MNKVIFFFTGTFVHPERTFIISNHPWNFHGEFLKMESGIIAGNSTENVNGSTSNLPEKSQSYKAGKTTLKREFVIVGITSSWQNA